MHGEFPFKLVRRLRRCHYDSGFQMGVTRVVFAGVGAGASCRSRAESMMGDFFSTFVKIRVNEHCTCTVSSSRAGVSQYY